MRCDILHTSSRGEVNILHTSSRGEVNILHTSSRGEVNILHTSSRGEVNILQQQFKLGVIVQVCYTPRLQCVTYTYCTHLQGVR